jgi:hypothetical protein
MNRTSRVAQILESWASQEIIGEIIICDWSSNEELINNLQIQEIIKKYNKTKIIRIDDQETFNLAKAYNLAYKFTNPNFKFLLKIDADYLLNNSSIFNLLFSYDLDKFFFGGNRETQNGWFVYHGFFFIKKKYYPSFNENLLATWGKDDEELYSNIYETYKLQIIYQIGLPKYIYHIPHSSKLRYENYKIKNQFDYIEIQDKSFKKWSPQEYIILEEKENYIKVKAKDKHENLLIPKCQIYS